MNEVTPKSLNYSTFLQPYYSQCTYFAISDITFQGNTIHSRWSRSTCDRLVKVALYKWMHLYNNGPWLEMKTIIGTEDKERKSQIIITAPPKHYLSHSTPLIGEGKILMCPCWQINVLQALQGQALWVTPGSLTCLYITGLSSLKVVSTMREHLPLVNCFQSATEFVVKDDDCLHIYWLYTVIICITQTHIETY